MKKKNNQESFFSVRPKPLFCYRSHTKTETQIDQYFRQIL